MTDVQDKQLDLASPEEAAKGEALLAKMDVPEMEPLGSPYVDLLVGVPINGKMVKRATVRELNGDDEEAMAEFQLAKPSESDNDVAIYDFLLKRACTHIGDVPTEGTNLLDLMTLGDRDKVFLGVVKASYGKEKMFHVQCPKCNEQLDVLINIDEEFPDIPVPPEMGEDGVLSVPLLKGKIARVKIPTGAAQMAAQQHEHFAGGLTAMIAECLVEITGGLPIAGSKLDIAKNLSIPDRQTLLRFFTEKRPGPTITTVRTDCEACNTSISVQMDWGSLLYP